MNLSRLFRFAALGALAACNGETSIEIAETGERPTVPAFFNCVRENDGLVIAAHRAGPAPGFPENAIETMENALSQGVYTFEIDVSTSRDGVLFLLHDRTLGRTTNISGRVADTDWDDIRDARLVDNDGATTAFTPPSLAQTLDWAVANNALLELDRKAPTTHDEIIEAVKRAGAQRHVVVITYTDAQARNVAELAPDLMMSASPDEDGDLSSLVDAGVDPNNVLVWTGTSRPNPRAWAQFSADGLEPAFGTIGRPGDRLDDEYLADGDLSEYQAFVDQDLVLLSTDAPFAVADALQADDKAVQACRS